MTPEERNMLERSLKLAEENNDMLRSIRRSGRYTMAFRAVYWLVIIGASFGAYYFIQPYINQLMDLYGGAQSALTNIKSFTGQ